MAARGAEALIPPWRNARVWRHGNRDGPRLMRDEHLRRIRQVGRRRWRLESGYSRRSLAETAFGRIKGIFGDRLRSRVFKNQETEGLLKVRALNIMTMLGMPDSYPAN
ncbi:MAG: transposase [Phycisphaerae bacterium]